MSKNQVVAVQVCSLVLGFVVITNELWGLGMTDLTQASVVNVPTCFMRMLFVSKQFKRCNDMKLQTYIQQE
jgi:hypothetical protein